MRQHCTSSAYRRLMSRASASASPWKTRCATLFSACSLSLSRISRVHQHRLVSQTKGIAARSHMPVVLSCPLQAKAKARAQLEASTQRSTKRCSQCAASVRTTRSSFRTRIMSFRCALRSSKELKGRTSHSLSRTRSLQTPLVSFSTRIFPLSLAQEVFTRPLSR